MEDSLKKYRINMHFKSLLSTPTSQRVKNVSIQGRYAANLGFQKGLSDDTFRDSEKKAFTLLPVRSVQMPVFSESFQMKY